MKFGVFTGSTATGCCKALARAGYLPVSYDNLIHGHREAVRWGPLEQGDIADRARLDEVIARHRPVAIMHFAAYAYVYESMIDPQKYYRNNVGGTAARNAGRPSCCVMVRPFRLNWIFTLSTTAVRIRRVASKAFRFISTLAPMSRTKFLPSSVIASMEVRRKDFP